MDRTWIIMLILFLILFFLIIVSMFSTTVPAYLKNGSVFPKNVNLVCTNQTSVSLEVFMINTNGDFIVMTDLNGSPLIVKPNGYFTFPITDTPLIQLFAVNPRINNLDSVYGTVITNINGLVQFSYWGSSTPSSWLFTTQSSSIVPTISIVSPFAQTNSVTRVTNPIMPPDTIALIHGAPFPTQLVLTNYNTSTVHYHIYSRTYSDVFYSISPNTFTTVDLAPFTTNGSITIIAIGAQGGIQGTVLHNVNGTVFYSYLFGQLALPSPQSIGILV